MVDRNRDSEPTSGLTTCVNAATGRCCKRGRRSPVDDGHHLASYDTSLVVSDGVDCGRRRRNVYDKKPQPYAKDNITAHLTACSDKKRTNPIHFGNNPADILISIEINLEIQIRIPDHILVFCAL